MQPGPRGGMSYNQGHSVYGATNQMKSKNSARNFEYQDQARNHFLSEAITKGVLTARRSSATPYATSENTYGNVGRSTVGKVINSQGAPQRNRTGEAKVPLNQDKIRKLGYKNRQ